MVWNALCCQLTSEIVGPAVVCHRTVQDAANLVAAAAGPAAEEAEASVGASPPLESLKVGGQGPTGETMDMLLTPVPAAAAADEAEEEGEDDDEDDGGHDHEEDRSMQVI